MYSYVHQQGVAHGMGQGGPTHLPAPPGLAGPRELLARPPYTQAGGPGPHQNSTNAILKEHAEASEGEGLEAALRTLSVQNARAWATLGEIAKAINPKDPAGDEYFERALVNDRYSLRGLVGVGERYKSQGQYSKAGDLFQTALQVDDKDAQAWAGLAWCLLMLNHLEDSYLCYQHAILYTKNPRDAQMWYGIGLLYERLGEHPHALEAFTAALKMDPQLDPARVRMAVLFAEQRRDYDKGVQMLQEVLQGGQGGPDMRADVFMQLGHVYELKGDIGAATQSYLHVLDLKKDHHKALQQLGALYFRRKDDAAAAIEYLKRATEIEPKDGECWYLLGRCYMSTDQHQLAWGAYEQAVTTNPEDPNVWCSLGVLYYQLNQQKDALDAYTRAITLDPKLCEVWYNVGTLYDSCNQYNDALHAYSKALENGATDKFVYDRVAALQALIGAAPPDRGQHAPRPMHNGAPHMEAAHLHGAHPGMPHAPHPQPAPQARHPQGPPTHLKALGMPNGGPHGHPYPGP